jgi:hypothetical protein
MPLAITTESWLEFLAVCAVGAGLCYAAWRWLRSSGGRSAVGRTSFAGLGALVVFVLGVALLLWLPSQKPVTEAEGSWLDASGKVTVSSGTYDAIRVASWLIVLGGLAWLVLLAVRSGGNPFAPPPLPAAPGSQPPEPGWHPDPADPTVERWWTGTAWGTQARLADRSRGLHPPPPPPPPPPAPVAATEAASFCPRCGQGVQPDDDFCRACGTALRVETH